MEKFDLVSAFNILVKYEFKRIALQFPDEELSHCVEVYRTLKHMLPVDTDLFITADSTWGSSVDDISAMHYDADVLIYFGSDLSSSGSLPVLIVPPRKALDTKHLFAILQSYFAETGMSDRKLLLLYETGYAHRMEELVSFCDFVPLICAKLPAFADLNNWSSFQASSLNDCEVGGPSPLLKIGGLLVDSDYFSDCTSDNQQILYVGEKAEQIVNIVLRASNHSVLCYSPSTSALAATSSINHHQHLQVIRGSESREFRERYGGVLRVKAAKVVGIIIGSMGLTAEITRDIVHRLETLVSAAHKKHYCFVMGRLNEAKLCNFPEVDIFCLVSNDDNANIKPKTFHVPVVTPFELELGLGARDWTSSFSTDIAALVGSGEEDLRQAVEKVRCANPADELEDSDDDGAAVKECCVPLLAETGATMLLAVQPSMSDGPSSGGENQHLAIFRSAAADFFRARDYQGLVAEVPESQDTDVHSGAFGTSVNYRPCDLR